MTSADDHVLSLCMDSGLITKEELEKACCRLGAGADDSQVLEYLLGAGLVQACQIYALLADSTGLDLVDLELTLPEQSALELLDAAYAEKYQVLPLCDEGGILEVVVADPLNMAVMDDLSYLTGRMVKMRLATPGAVRQAIAKFYQSIEVNAIVRETPARGYSTSEDEPQSIQNLEGTGSFSKAEAPIIRYVEKIIQEALRRSASDIHLEPLESRFRIRYRVDGVLQEGENPPQHLQQAIISRLKIMAHISIAEKRLPQDGRITFRSASHSLDLRVSTLPTAFGESVVMRILDRDGLLYNLSDLGFFRDDQVAFEHIISQPDGIFLVTGPTGSGKTTTLYSVLHQLNQADCKIITVEDPVELEMTGVNQVQVKPEVGMTFASALRSMLRQAPNIIMVGEIRDTETAEIALNASLTGHMVYSSLHTNDAPSAVHRLNDLGIPPFLISASLRGVLAQRLVRQIDPVHNEPYNPSESELPLYGILQGQQPGWNFRRGVPHPDNGGTGFRGRKGIFELLAVDETLEILIYQQSSLVELRRCAREQGMRTMREDGLRKVVAGFTTLEEVLNVTVETHEI